jgi:hypothetical protein
MSRLSDSKWNLMLGAFALVACAGGEYTSADFGEGPPGPDAPPPSQQGQSTPVPNFTGCQDPELDSDEGSFSGCGNACFECIADAEDDVNASVACIYGAACRAYFAAYADSVPDDGIVEGNILLTPNPQPAGGDDCENETDACGLCVCLSASADDCAELCASG